MAMFVILVLFLRFELSASAKCTAPDPKKFPLTWPDKKAAFDCMPEETKHHNPYTFNYYCKEANCFTLYEDQAIKYQWDTTCRKCVPCTASVCRPPNLDSGPTSPCEPKDGCTTAKPVDCGEHGTNLNSYVCKCDAGWKNNVEEATFCDVRESHGAATLAANPEAEKKSRDTNATIIIVFVSVVVFLLAICSCCLAYFCKNRKDNQEVRRFIQQAKAGTVPYNSKMNAGKQVKIMQMASRTARKNQHSQQKNQNTQQRSKKKTPKADKETPAGELVTEEILNRWKGLIDEFYLEERKAERLREAERKRTGSEHQVPHHGMPFMTKIVWNPKK